MRRFEAITREVHERLKVVMTAVPYVDDDLGGACLVGAAVLYERLAAEGFDPVLVHGDKPNFGHFWVEVEGWILDPTYSQFGSGDVLVSRKPHPIAFDVVVKDACIPDDDGWEMPQRYWRRFRLGRWRDSRVRKAGGFKAVRCDVCGCCNQRQREEVGSNLCGDCFWT